MDVCACEAQVHAVSAGALGDDCVLHVQGPGVGAAGAVEAAAAGGGVAVECAVNDSNVRAQGDALIVDRAAARASRVAAKGAVCDRYLAYVVDRSSVAGCTGASSGRVAFKGAIGNRHTASL